MVIFPIIRKKINTLEGKHTEKYKKNSFYSAKIYDGTSPLNVKWHEIIHLYTGQ